MIVLFCGVVQETTTKKGPKQGRAVKACTTGERGKERGSKIQQGCAAGCIEDLEFGPKLKTREVFSPQPAS